MDCAHELIILWVFHSLVLIFANLSIQKVPLKTIPFRIPIELLCVYVCVFMCDLYYLKHKNILKISPSQVSFHPF